MGLLISTSFFSQNPLQQQQIDSLTQKFKKDSAHIYRFKIVRPFAAIDNRNSFTKDGPLNVKGFQLGVIIKEKHTVGYGIYSLQNSSKQNVTSQNEKNIPAKRNLTLSYLTLFYQYVIIDRRFFELDLPLEVGLGSYHITLEDTFAHKLIADKKGGVSLTSGGVNLIFKPVRWIGVSGTFGYRIALDKNPNLNFSGAYYSIGLWVDLRQIYRDTRFYGFTRKKYRRELRSILKDN
ncbi:MAG: hypothetical protein V4677_06975 [Bacteroidota bacterium]